jgi:hypothetical protein
MVLLLLPWNSSGTPLLRQISREAFSDSTQLNPPDVTKAEGKGQYYIGAFARSNRLFAK